MSRLLKWIAIFLSASMLNACAPKPRTVLHEINFAADPLPSSVNEISGFSGLESWGRWTDAKVAPTAKIRFARPLPREFAVVITGQSVPEHESAEIKVGDFKQEFFIHGVGDTTTVHVELASDSVDTIEIQAKHPASPKKLGLNNDSRELGVGLSRLAIEIYSK